MEKFRKLLSSVGVSTFIEYYEVFEANESADSCEEIKEALRKKGIWKESSVSTKANCGKKIFEAGQEAKALMYILKAKNVPNGIKKRAHELLIKSIVDSL